MRTFAVLVMFSLFAACGPAPTSSQTSSYDQRFPSGPDSRMTPGALCQHADSYRYPEHIAYCSRDVSGSTKDGVIADYDRQFGYNIENMNRQDFKIDHFIPLCMGGANSVDNLWPQHKSIYGYTDPIEPMLCDLMSKGKMMQSEAVSIIREAKANLPGCDAIQQKLEARK